MTHCSHYTEICSYVLRPRSFGGVCIPGYRCGISAIRADIALRTRIAERERPHVNTNEATNTAGARGVAGPGPGSRRVRPCGTGRDTVTDERVREFAYEARLPYVIIVNSILAKNDYLRYERGQSLLFLRPDTLHRYGSHTGLPGETVCRVVTLDTLEGRTGQGLTLEHPQSLCSLVHAAPAAHTLPQAHIKKAPHTGSTQFARSQPRLHSARIPARATSSVFSAHPTTLVCAGSEGRAPFLQCLRGIDNTRSAALSQRLSASKDAGRPCSAASSAFGEVRGAPSRRERRPPRHAFS